MRYFNILKFSILIFLLAIAVHSTAQKVSFDGGILAGIYGVDITGDKKGFWKDEYEKSGILGISAGAFVKCIFTPDLYGVLELRFIQKGSRYGYINKFFTQSFETIRFNYLEIPILYGTNGVFHTKAAEVNFTFETGFAYSKLFSSKLNYDVQVRREIIATLNGFRNYDISWIAQIKLPYRTKDKHSFLLGLRLERSLFPINKNYKLYNFDYGLELNYLFMNL
jgi:hypothetical protein